MEKLTLAMMLLCSISICCGKSSKKSNDAPHNQIEAVCQLANYASLSHWGDDGKPVQMPINVQLHCLEGDLSGSHFDCTGASSRQSEKEKSYFHRFENGVCPKGGIISTCQLKTGTLYLYDSDLNTDKEFFKQYCEFHKGSPTH
jgi:hypothetical protein